MTFPINTTYGVESAPSLTNDTVGALDYSGFRQPSVDDEYEDYSLRQENEDLLAENDKLRELVRRYGEYTDQDRCEGCVYKRSCNDGDVDECWQLTEIRGLARELGIEVPE